MFAVFNMAGIVPDSYDILNMTVSIGATNGASFFKTLGFILFGPAALVGFSLPRSFFHARYCYVDLIYLWCRTLHLTAVGEFFLEMCVIL